MAGNRDVEEGKSSGAEEVRAPLLLGENGGGGDEKKPPFKKEDRCMVYLSTFVAVCGSYAFGSCVCGVAPSLSSSPLSLLR